MRALPSHCMHTAVQLYKGQQCGVGGYIHKLDSNTSHSVSSSNSTQFLKKILHFYSNTHNMSKTLMKSCACATEVAK